MVWRKVYYIIAEVNRVNFQYHQVYCFISRQEENKLAKNEFMRVWKTKKCSCGEQKISASI